MLPLRIPSSLTFSRLVRVLREVGGDSVQVLAQSLSLLPSHILEQLLAEVGLVVDPSLVLRVLLQFRSFHSSSIISQSKST